MNYPRYQEGFHAGYKKAIDDLNLTTTNASERQNKMTVDLDIPRTAEERLARLQRKPQADLEYLEQAEAHADEGPLGEPAARAILAIALHYVRATHTHTPDDAALTKVGKVTRQLRAMLNLEPKDFSYVEMAAIAEAAELLAIHTPDNSKLAKTGKVTPQQVEAALDAYTLAYSSRRADESGHENAIKAALRAALPLQSVAGEEAIARAWNDARSKLCVCKSPTGKGIVQKAGPDWPVGYEGDEKLFAGTWDEIDEWVDLYCARAVLSTLAHGGGTIALAGAGENEMPLSPPAPKSLAPSPETIALLDEAGRALKQIEDQRSKLPIGARYVCKIAGDALTKLRTSEPTTIERYEHLRQNAEVFVAGMKVMIESLERDGKIDEATHLKVWCLMPWEAAIRDDDSGELWPKCEACGLPIKSKVEIVAGEDCEFHSECVASGERT